MQSIASYSIFTRYEPLSYKLGDAYVHLAWHILEASILRLIQVIKFTFLKEIYFFKENYNNLMILSLLLITGMKKFTL